MAKDMQTLPAGWREFYRLVDVLYCDLMAQRETVREPDEDDGTEDEGTQAKAIAYSDREASDVVIAALESEIQACCCQV